MARNTKDKYTKERKPFIVLVLEGKNQTERKYFQHFCNRNTPYRLFLEDCESTDIDSMVKKAKLIYSQKDLDKKYGDHIFVIFDLDLDKGKEEKFEAIKNAKPNSNIEFIVSNPCFEIWFMYYFNKSPKRLNSSQRVKDEMKKYIPNYSEELDTFNCIQDIENNHNAAIESSINKNKHYSDNSHLLDKNPYTQVHKLVHLLLNYQKK